MPHHYIENDIAWKSFHWKLICEYTRLSRYFAWNRNDFRLQIYCAFLVLNFHGQTRCFWRTSPLKSARSWAGWGERLVLRG